MWTVDEGLDPAALKSEKPRKQKAAKPDEPPPEPWTVERFVEAFLGEPATRAELIAAAKDERLSIGEAKRLIALAIAEGRVEEEAFNGRTAPRMWAKRDPAEVEGSP